MLLTEIETESLFNVIKELKIRRKSNSLYIS